MIDYLCFAGTKEGRVAEYIDHLHEHFVAPCVVENAAYQVHRAPGYSIEMKPETLIDYAWPRSSRARRAPGGSGRRTPKTPPKTLPKRAEGYQDYRSEARSLGQVGVSQCISRGLPI